MLCAQSSICNVELLFTTYESCFMLDLACRDPWPSAKKRETVLLGPRQNSSRIKSMKWLLSTIKRVITSRGFHRPLSMKILGSFPILLISFISTTIDLRPYLSTMPTYNFHFYSHFLLSKSGNSLLRSGNSTSTYLIESGN